MKELFLVEFNLVRNTTASTGKGRIKERSFRLVKAEDEWDARSVLRDRFRDMGMQIENVEAYEVIEE